ncbi:MAG: efflux RND transporter periplasmic adaptor subunit [Planctomycetota bacterium]|nr:efflux RND transporter periplasmic adaptor subunit [Planctomycetota bacterium]
MQSLRSIRRAGAVSLCAIVSLGVLAGLPAVAGQPGSLRPVRNSDASRGLDPSIISAFSSIKAVTRPSRDAIMGFTVPTKVTEIVVRGGQEVTKGRVHGAFPLLKLQKVRADTDLPVARARKQMELADTEYKIQQEVRAGGGSSDQQLQRAKLSFEVSQIDVSKAQMEQTQEVIQVERLEARVEKFRIDAPFDGIVDNVMLDVGHSASENDKVVRVVNVDHLWIDAPAPTQDAVTLTLKVGDPAWVLVDMAGSPIVREGKVIEAAPTADAASRTRRVRVEVPNPKGAARLLAGEPSYVRFTPPSDEFKKLVESFAAAAKAAD